MSGTEPGRAAYEHRIAAEKRRFPTRRFIVWDALSPAEQADEAAAAMAETREISGQLFAAHAETRHFLARIDALVRELEASAARTAPSKKSEIEAATAKRLRAITGTDAGLDVPEQLKGAEGR